MSTKDVKSCKKRGLLQPPRRSARRYKGHDWRKGFGYFQEHLERLRFVSRALAYGFSFEAIERLVTTTGLVTCRDVLIIADAELERLRGLAAPDSPGVAALTQLRDRCTGIGGRKDCAIYVALAGDGPLEPAPPRQA
jgi:DNA-binding transcriptional MerR regulator